MSNLKTTRTKKNMKKILILLFISTLLNGCGNNKYVPFDDPIPKYDTFKIKSSQVDEERIINIWTPTTYQSGNEKYPVMYMADGGIKEDFPHIANTLSKLIASKSISPIILVGIENTDRRRDLTGFSESKYDAKYCPTTDGAKKFRAFITQELIPEINSQYRTSEKKGIIGESLSGLFVMETMMLHPEIFDFYIAFDPSLWWNDHYLVENAEALFAKFPEKEIKLWFAGSSVKDISKHTKNLNKFLEINSPKNLNWKYANEPKEKHHTIFRATKEKAIIWTLNDVK